MTEPTTMSCVTAAVPVKVDEAEHIRWDPTHKAATRQPETGPGGGPLLNFIASTGTIDRYNQIIEPEGWVLDNYRKNPVFLNSHKSHSLENTIGRALVTEVRRIEGRPFLFQTVEFAVEANPTARLAYDLYRRGYLSAVSVGFIPMRWQDGTGTDTFRRRYLKQELVEVSAVAVPANPDALVLAGFHKPLSLLELARRLRSVLYKKN
jgi:HK97 family phage prohead protease